MDRARLARRELVSLAGIDGAGVKARTAVAVTVWLTASSFVHLIAWPALTVILAGTKRMLRIATATEPADEPGLVGGAAALEGGGAEADLLELLPPQPAITRAAAITAGMRSLTGRVMRFSFASDGLDRYFVKAGCARGMWRPTPGLLGLAAAVGGAAQDAMGSA